jgi:LAS superfamily LD-carboxypeptidase LdcB
MHKLLNNADHHQLMDQLHAEQELTLLANKDVLLQLQLKLHQLHVIVTDKQSHNVVHHQQMDQPLAEQELMLLANKDVLLQLQLELQFNLHNLLHVIVTDKLLNNAVHHQQTDQLLAELKL